MVEDRLSRLRRDVVNFYQTPQGKDFVKRFMAEGFSLEYDTAPNVVAWTLKNPIEGKDPQFLLSAVGSGYLTPEQGKRDIFLYWAKVARDVTETLENSWVHEQGLLGEPRRIKEIYIPMLRAFRERRGVYSGRTVITTLRGLYGLGKILNNDDGATIRKQSLDRTYGQPGSYLLSNLPAIEAVVEEVLARKDEFADIAQRSITTPGFVQNVLLAHPDLHAKLQGRTTGKGKVEMVPIPENQMDLVIPNYFRIELERYRERMTFPNDSIHLRER